MAVPAPHNTHAGMTFITRHINDGAVCKLVMFSGEIQIKLRLRGPYNGFRGYVQNCILPHVSAAAQVK